MGLYFIPLIENIRALLAIASKINSKLLALDNLDNLIDLNKSPLLTNIIICRIYLIN